MRLFLLIYFLFCLPLFVSAQELFPYNEPASNVPKGVLGIRTYGEIYQEGNIHRNMGALRLMYGLTSKLSIAVTVSESNHHNSHLPTDSILVKHQFINGQHIYTTTTKQNIVIEEQYPYSFNGFYFFAKYRFITKDGQNTHFRTAVYGEYSTVNQPFPHAEPNLMMDTKGYGGGLIITYLKNRFAVSLTSGVIIPGSYQETVAQTAGSPVLTNTILEYGRSTKYNLSFGYLVFPKEYKNYNQVNYNLYLEFMGKTYEAATVYQDGKILPIQSVDLSAGNYIDVCPGIQAIVKSNLRIDFSMGFNMINRSYSHNYPIYMIGIQRYFFL